MKSPSRHPCLSLILLLCGAAGTIGAQPPSSPTRTPPPAASLHSPEAIDAWGQTVPAELLVDEMMSSNVMIKMGTRAWTPIAMRILRIERGTIARLYWSAGADVLCGKRYRRQFPASTAEQYRKFKGTSEGASWTKTCIAELLDDPHTDPRILDGMAASLEVALTVPVLLMEAREKRIEQGLEDLPELTPEMEAALPGKVQELFASSACLVRKALEKEKLGTLVTEPAIFQAQILAAMQSGACGNEGSEPSPARQR